MNNEQLKSVIRHALTAVGAVLLFIGAGKITGLFEYLINNFDSLWAAITVIAGLITTVIGFFKEPQRFNLRKGE